MTAIAHLHGVRRHGGKPTSGRYVYRAADSGGWYWQCDLHDGDEAEPDEYGPTVPTMQEAFAGALAHASVCVPFWVERAKA